MFNSGTNILKVEDHTKYKTINNVFSYDANLEYRQMKWKDSSICRSTPSCYKYL